MKLLNFKFKIKMQKIDALQKAGASISSKCFSKYYDLTNKVICNGDIFELR